jgi:hypothetical protein
MCHSGSVEESTAAQFVAGINDIGDQCVTAAAWRSQQQLSLSPVSTTSATNVSQRRRGGVKSTAAQLVAGINNTGYQCVTSGAEVSTPLVSI